MTGNTGSEVNQSQAVNDLEGINVAMQSVIAAINAIPPIEAAIQTALGQIATGQVAAIAQINSAKDAAITAIKATQPAAPSIVDNSADSADSLVNPPSSGGGINNRR